MGRWLHVITLVYMIQLMYDVIIYEDITSHGNAYLTDNRGRAVHELSLYLACHDTTVYTHAT